jgi:phage gp46-like protein
MADIATLWTNTGGDWVLQPPALAEDAGLYTAIALSLFTDRLAGEGDALPDTSARGRRGWWGDSYAEVEGDLIGSHLWLLSREKLQPQALRRAEEYCQAALQWLVDDGVARSVSVAAVVPPGRELQGLVQLTVTVTRSAQPVASYRFEAFWKGA